MRKLKVRKLKVRKLKVRKRKLHEDTHTCGGRRSALARGGWAETSAGLTCFRQHYVELSQPWLAPTSAMALDQEWNFHGVPDGTRFPAAARPTAGGLLMVARRHSRVGLVQRALSC